MPDFDSLYSKHDCDMLQDAYDAISKCELWDWMRDFTPGNEGFMLTQHPNLSMISENMKYAGHSGTSYAWTMRTMQGIAKAGGWDAYRAIAVSRWPKDYPVCRCRKARGMTIGWCGVAGGGVPGCDH